MRNSFLPFLAYLVLFYLAWTFVWVHGLYPWANRELGNATLAYALVSIAARFAIWVLPVCVYIRYVDKTSVAQYLRLTSHWKRGIVVGLVVSFVDIAGTFARLGPPDWSRVNLTWNSVLGTSVLVGVFEEVPFRGFVLQKLQERFDFWAATVLSSLLFVAAHVPGWIALGSLTVRNVVYIFVFGVVMAVLFRYSRSLWAPILTHSLNDGLSSVVFHI